MARKKLPPPTGALAGRQTKDGRRRLHLNRHERRDLVRSELIEAACAKFLDTTEHHTWKEIAEELGITLDQLKGLTRSEEFEDKYNLMFAELGQHRFAIRNVLNSLARLMLILSKETPQKSRVSPVKTVKQKGLMQAMFRKI